MQENLITIPSFLANIALMVLFMPLFSFLILFFFAKYLPQKGDWLASLLSGINAILSIVLFSTVISQQTISGYLLRFDWFQLGNHHFQISFLIDTISTIMLVIVTFISFLVNLYSIEYMRGKRNYQRYFPYLSIFTFAMLGIVLSHNLLLTFMFWELVGFSSYLLIGFWFDKASAVKASKKAFLFNRIGDVGFLIALLLVYNYLHTFDLSEIKKLLVSNSWVTAMPFWISLAGLGFFAACVGKSAQFPLQVWLPDAMEGPTPVSALIHAATMVAAGIYLLVKVHFLLTPEVKIFIAFTGATTAFIGAVPALFQNDIKKVLAYSTISQLGYMVMGMGMGSYAPSFFHLITHAFFKACLFLSVGSIIHAMHEIKYEMFLHKNYNDFDLQDMRLMGGFYKKMPIAFGAYLASSLALIGVPLFSGALSKELLLEQSWVWAQQQAAEGKFVFYIIPILAYSTLLITCLYVFRQLFMVFFGTFRLAEIDIKAKEHFNQLKESHWLLNIPLILLAILSMWWVFAINPIDGTTGWLMLLLGADSFSFHFSPVPLLIIALGVVIFLWRKKELQETLYFFKLNGHSNTSSFLKAIRNDWNMDALYYHTLVNGGFSVATIISKIDTKIIDPLIHAVSVTYVIVGHLAAWVDKYIINGMLHVLLHLNSSLGAFTRSFQGGKVQQYFLFVFVVALGALAWAIF